MMWPTGIKVGDWASIVLGMIAVAWLLASFWAAGAGDRVAIRSGGKLVAEAPLDRAQRIAVNGPLGVSVIEIEPRRARVQSDPSPRQLCVRQGWLTQAGDVAICLPNQVSVELLGASKRYDSLNY